jgi:arginine repressor
MKTIEEFKKNAKTKKRSKLTKFKNEIIELESLDYSHTSIVSFLAQNGVKTTQQNVSYFLKKCKKNVRKEVGTSTEEKEKKEPMAKDKIEAIHDRFKHLL